MARRPLTSTTAYDKHPTISVTADDTDCSEGWPEVLATIAGRARQQARCVVAVECFPGVDSGELGAAIGAGLRPELSLQSEEALHAPAELERLLRPHRQCPQPSAAACSLLEEGGRAEVERIEESCL